MPTWYWITCSDSKVCNFCLAQYLRDFSVRNYCKALRRIRHQIQSEEHEQTCRCWPSRTEREPRESPYKELDYYLAQNGFPRLTNEECKKAFDDFT